MPCWQKPGMTIDAYTRDFKANIEVCKAAKSGIGISISSTKLACKSARYDYDALISSVNGTDITMLKKMEALGRTRYMAALHFEGLNRMRYGVL